MSRSCVGMTMGTERTQHMFFSKKSSYFLHFNMFIVFHFHFCPFPFPAVLLIDCFSVFLKSAFHPFRKRYILTGQNFYRRSSREQIFFEPRCIWYAICVLKFQMQPFQIKWKRKNNNKNFSVHNEVLRGCHNIFRLGSLLQSQISHWP